MEIDSIISQLESEELSCDYSVHNKTKKKIKLTQLPTQINVNRIPTKSPSISSSSSKSSTKTSTPPTTYNNTTQSSTTSPHLSEFTPPSMPPYPITNPTQHPETIEDLKRQTEHSIDTELIKLYGDTVHRNLGTHLTGNIDNDSQWYYIWFQLISYHHPLYSPPQSKLGRDIVKTLSQEFQGVRERKWNSEKALLFPIIILRKPHQKLTSQEIKHRLRFRLNQWKMGNFIELATDTITEAFQYHTSKPPPLDIDEKLQIFNQLVYHGKLREALRFLTNKHEENTLLQPNDTDLKTSKSVLEVLKSKHPPLRIQDITQKHFKLDEYDFVPQPLSLQFTENDVKNMASNLHGSGGPTSLDSSLLSDLLLRYGTSSTLFRDEMAQWTEWLANDSPPWAAYRATMATRAVAFNKFPGVRPLSIGESYRRLWARLIISQTRDQAKAACNTTELCAGLEAGIDGAIHAVRASTLNKSSFQSPIDTFHKDSTSHPNKTPPPNSTSPSNSTTTPSLTSLTSSLPTSSTTKTKPSSPTPSPFTSPTNTPLSSSPLNQSSSTLHPTTSETTTSSPNLPVDTNKTHQYNLQPRTPQLSNPPDSHRSTSSSSTNPTPVPSKLSHIDSPPTQPNISSQPSTPQTTASTPHTENTSSSPSSHSSTHTTKSPQSNQCQTSHSSTASNPTPHTNISSHSPIPSTSPITPTSKQSPSSSTTHDFTLNPLDVTLLDASNGFNEISRLRCLHTIRHLWPSASRFAFNCYRHSIQVCIREHNSPAIIIPGCEGIQQGDPLSMILYGLALTPLINRIHTEHSSIFLSENFLDPWYADDATIVASVTDTIIIVQEIQKLGPIYGYFIQPEKSFHICSSSQISKSKPLFAAANLHFQYVQGT